jgi:hypothetical protein
MRTPLRLLHDVSAVAEEPILDRRSARRTGFGAIRSGWHAVACSVQTIGRGDFAANFNGLARGRLWCLLRHIRDKCSPGVQRRHGTIPLVVLQLHSAGDPIRMTRRIDPGLLPQASCSAPDSSYVRHRTEVALSGTQSTRRRNSTHSIMTSRVRTSTYKGATVVIRWQELKRTDPPGSLFVAGYALTSGDGRETEWRQFDSPTFRTRDAAVAYALGEAHRAIDAQRMPLNGTPKVATGLPVH